MKPAFKYLFVVLVGLFLVVACGPVTPVSSATSTVTITATAIRRPTATATPTEAAPAPQPTVSVRLLAQLPPSQPVDKYELMPWTSELRSKVMKIFDDNGYDLWPGDYDELGLKYSASFGNEAWLHAQSNDEKKAAMCSVVFEAPGSDLFRGLRLGQDLFSFFVEEMLNDEDIAIEQLTDEFRNRFGQGCLGGFSLNGTGNIYFEPAVVRNLFGNGQDAYVFAVGTIFGDNRVAIYATHAVEGSIRIERVRDWERYTSIASSTKIRLVDVGDVNANGYNELVIDVHYGGSGYPGNSAEWLYWHEWHPDVQSFVGGETINVFAHGKNVGPEFGEWSLAKANIPEAVSVTAHEFLSTRLDVCEFLTIEKNYLVSRTGVTLKSEGLLFPNNSILACEVSWAYEILMQPDGWKNDRAIQILSNAMDDWPLDMNSAWEGAATQNYFRLMLGIWRDFRGETDLAVEMLETLRLFQAKKPGFLSELAQTYLDTRQANGVIAACSAMNSQQRELLGEKYGDSAARLMDFRRPRWWTSVDNFCDELASTSAVSQNLSRDYGEVSNVDELQEWLVREQKSDIYVEKSDVGQHEVWLVSFLAQNLSQHDVNVYQLWAFVKTPWGLDAEFLHEMRLDQTRDNVAERYNENSISAQVFAPKLDIQMILIEFNDCLTFLQVSSTGNLRVLGGECGTELFFYAHHDRVDVLKNRYVYPREWEVKTYRWNSATQTMNFNENERYDFSATQREAEKLLVLPEFVVKEEMRHDRLKLCPEDSQHASTKVYQRPDGSYKTAEENHAPNRNGAIQRNCG